MAENTGCGLSRIMADMDVKEFTRMMSEPSLEPNPGYGELFTAEDFLKEIQRGSIIPYEDGSAYWATSTHHEQKRYTAVKPEWATHVMWFNK
jgi:hypothetical protein